MKTSRAQSYSYFIDAPQPTVTIMRTLDVTKIVRYSKKSGRRLNMLMCYCLGKAASEIPEFMTMIVHKKMYRYDKLGISMTVKNDNGVIDYCDIPFFDDLDEFQRSYVDTTAEAARRCSSIQSDDMALIGVSALVKYEIDGIVNMYSGIFDNPFAAWGKYTSHLFGKQLKISLTFHHVQMDGEHACRFLDALQRQLNEVPGSNR